MKLVAAMVLVISLVIWLVPAIPVDIFGALIITVFGFFFATVASRIVGLVGSSNNPVSGMTIATLLIATVIFKAIGMTGQPGMTGAIAVGSIIAIIAAISGDTSQDLKTGYIVGSTPQKQQIGELLGVIISALAIGGISLPAQRSLGLRFCRASRATGRFDENGRGRRYGWKPPLDPCLYRRGHRSGG